MRRSLSCSIVRRLPCASSTGRSLCACSTFRCTKSARSGRGSWADSVNIGARRESQVAYVGSHGRDAPEDAQRGPAGQLSRHSGPVHEGRARSRRRATRSLASDLSAKNRYVFVFNCTHMSGICRIQLAAPAPGVAALPPPKFPLLPPLSMHPLFHYAAT